MTSKSVYSTSRVGQINKTALAKTARTPWFPANVKPQREGVYETNVGYQHWNKCFWGLYCSDVAQAAEVGAYRSNIQRPTWRGLASNPAKAK